jgi:DNA-directed RNA polymerase subunit F
MEEELSDDGEIILSEEKTTAYFDQFGKIDMSKKVEELLRMLTEMLFLTLCTKLSHFYKRKINLKNL